MHNTYDCGDNSDEQYFPGPPQFCGVDQDSGDDAICCSDSKDVMETKTQAPQYPRLITARKIGPRSCEDTTYNCAKWVKKSPESCLPGHESYYFMRLACQESCGRCQTNVSKISCIFP